MSGFRNITLAACTVIAISLSLACSTAAQEQKELSRGVDQFKLDTSLPELNRLVELMEIENPMIEIYKKFGFGNPEVAKEIDHRLGRRYFEARKNLSEGVGQVSLHF